MGKHVLGSVWVNIFLKFGCQSFDMFRTRLANSVPFLFKTSSGNHLFAALKPHVLGFDPKERKSPRFQLLSRLPELSAACFVVLSSPDSNRPISKNYFYSNTNTFQTLWSNQYWRRLNSDLFYCLPSHVSHVLFIVISAELHPVVWHAL